MRVTEAAYRDILGLSYSGAFSAEWNTADLGFFKSSSNASCQRASFFLVKYSSFPANKLLSKLNNVEELEETTL